MGQELEAVAKEEKKLWGALRTVSFWTCVLVPGSIEVSELNPHDMSAFPEAYCASIHVS